MLTGMLPFTAADPMEWVHCHVARQPVPPDERVAGLPGPLSAIVMKPPAKTAEERYQTAAGVEADLRRGLAEWESHGRIDPFLLGAYDVSDRLLIPEKLYGREREIDALVAVFDRVVAQDTTELVLVSGYSGIGKSSVVNELHKALVPPRGLFASGKFDQYKRDIPYATLGQAFQTLVRSLLTQNEEALGRWRDCLLEALGPNGELIVNLVPELELVIGKQPPVPDLPPQDAKNRFQMVFRRFLSVFARKEHPLALFLDDLQWLDAATLDLIEHLVTHSEVQHLLLVGAYRDNEVGPTHPLLRTLAAIRDADVRACEIMLAPLELDDVSRLIADALHYEPGRARPLAELVQEKTGGNPFFAIQFFFALADEGLLRFDHDAGRWRWKLDRIHAKGYTDNVVDLMVGRLTRLPVQTQAALQQFACLGNAAEITMLSIVLGKSSEDVGLDLWDAVRLELVERLEHSYKLVHDRVQEAAYSLIPERLRLEALSTRATNTVERATVACLRLDLYTTLDQSSRAIAVGLEYLRHLGINWSPHPTNEEARHEYEQVWSQLGSRMIEDLIELPLMSDPASLATMDVLTKMATPSLYTDTDLLALVACRAVNLSLESGNCDGSCMPYVWLPMVAGPRFGDYRTAVYRFGQLGYDLVERRGLTRFQARTYELFGYGVVPWTRHVRAGRDPLRRAFEAALKNDHPIFSAYCGTQLNTNLLAAGEPLAEAEGGAPQALAFSEEVRFVRVLDCNTGQLGLMRSLRGLTPIFGCFDDEQFN